MAVNKETSEKIKAFLTKACTFNINTSKERLPITTEVKNVKVKNHIEKTTYIVNVDVKVNNKLHLKQELEFDFPNSLYAYSNRKTNVTIARINNEVKIYKKGVASNTVFINFETNEVGVGNYLNIRDIEVAKKILESRKVSDEDFKKYIYRELKTKSQLEWVNKYNLERWNNLPKMTPKWVEDEINNIKFKKSVTNKIRFCLKTDNPPVRLGKRFIECLTEMYERKLDVITPFDISFIDFDEEMLKYLDKNKSEIWKTNAKKLADNKQLYPNTIQTYIRRYLTGQGDTMRNVQQSVDTSPLSELSQGRKIFFVDANSNSVDEKIPININNFMGIIDSVFGSEQKSNIDNKLTNAVSFVGDKMFIKVLNKNFRELEVPIEEYLNNPVLTYENIDYRRKQIIKKEDDVYQCYLYGEYVYRPLKDVKYLRHMDSLVSYSTAKIPFLNKTYVGRGMYGANQQTQAVKTLGSDVTIINTGADNQVYNNTLSHIKSPVNGVVVSYKDNIAIIKDAKGEEYPVELKEEFKQSMNHTFNKYTPRFKVGQKVQKDDVLFAYDVFNKTGGLQLTTPTLVMIGTYMSMENNDSCVLSESYAKRNSLEEEMEIYVSLYKDKYKLKINPVTSDPYEKIGLPKIGDEIERGQEIFSYGEVLGDNNEFGNLYAKLNRANKKFIKQKTKVVPFEVSKGKITKIEIIPLQPYTEEYAPYLKAIEDECYKYKREVYGKKFKIDDEGFEDSEAECIIIIKASYFNSTSVGSKLSFLNGNKSTVSNILPDDKMPRLKDGRVIDMITSPLAEIPRMLGSQPYLLYLGKMAYELYKRLEKNDIDDDLVEALKYLFPEETKIDPKKILLKYGHNGFLRFTFYPFDNSINEEKLLELMKLCKVKQKEKVWDPVHKVWVRTLVDVGYMDVMFLYMAASKKLRYTPKTYYLEDNQSYIGYETLRGTKHGEEKYGTEMSRSGQSASETIGALNSWGSTEEYKTTLRNQGIELRRPIDDAFSQLMVRLETNF